MNEKSKLEYTNERFSLYTLTSDGRKNYFAYFLPKEEVDDIVQSGLKGRIFVEVEN